jgi:serine/threonine protein phosphatase PrpC
MLAMRTHRRDHLGAFKFLSVCRTHAGQVRTLNEDALLNRPDIGLWAVADGMGGHASGDYASQQIAHRLDRVDDFASAYQFRDAVERALQQANLSLRDHAKRVGGIVGSTVVALLAHQGHYACLWAGDSRAFLYRQGVLRRLTKDHSFVQEMVDAGVLTPAQARNHPKANIITRAVGADDELALESVSGLIHAGDRFLLCSDGLSNLVSEREMAESLRRTPLERGMDRMMEIALSRGAPDNVTGVVIAAEPA